MSKRTEMEVIKAAMEHDVSFNIVMGTIQRMVSNKEWAKRLRRWERAGDRLRTACAKHRLSTMNLGGRK